MNRRQMTQGLAAGFALAGARVEGQVGEVSGAAALRWVAVLPGIWKATVGVAEEHTPVRSRAVAPLVEALGRLPAAAMPVGVEGRGSVGARGCLLEMPIEPHELMYGFGLQMTSFQQRSKKRTIRVNADPKGDSGDSHAPAPWFVTTAGYGVLVDTFRQAEFYCGQVHPRPTRALKANEVAVNTPEDMREGDRAREGTVWIEVPRCKGVDVYLFAGPTMLGAVARYNLFAGGGVMPPEWGLGFWYRPEMHLKAAEVMKLAGEFRERKIPCDVLGLEPGWQTHAYSCTFAWDGGRFPDPRGFLGETAKLGYKVNLWEHAFTHPASPIFEAMVPHSGDSAVWGGLVPDFAGAPARKIFGEYHGRALIDAGVSGFKLDECDNSDFTGGWSFPDASRFPSGVDGEQMHAEFGMRYQDAIWGAFKERGKETYGLVRSSGALASPYPFVLYSDLYEHRVFVRALVNAGFSGLLWCPEVRDAVSEEDLIRRLQTVVFSPLAMVNAWYIRNPPWKQMDRPKNNRDELGEGWERLEGRCREILGWRMAMGLYLRGAFARYAADGTPPFRALVLDFPGVAGLEKVDDQYMMGDRMMVAPLFAGEAGRTVSMPPGEWHDFWTGARIAGGGVVTVERGMEKIPVYVKGGSVVPWAEVGGSSGDAASRRITMRVYGDDPEGWRAPWGGGEMRSGELGAVADFGSGGRPYRVVGWERVGVAG